jgi:hypothetical protein
MALIAPHEGAILIEKVRANQDYNYGVITKNTHR